MAAAVVLLLAAVVALLFALRFTAIAFDRGFSPFAWLPGTHSAGDRLLQLAAMIALLVAALSALLARGPARLKIALPGAGALEVRLAAMEHALRDAVEARPDVDRARVIVRSRRDGPAAQVSLQLASPSSDPEALRSELEECIRSAMRQATGMELTAVAVAFTATALPVTATTVTSAPAGDDAGQSPEPRAGAER